MSTVVELKNVTRRYGAVTAVKDVSLLLHRGEIVALVGENGAGKTTLMKLILGLVTPTSGSVSVFGGNPTGARGASLRHRLGFLPENVAFHGEMTARELMRFYARLKGAEEKRNKDLLALVGLAAAADRPVSTYSKGMRQRLGLAQALIGAPGLLLFDEPTSGLDPVARVEMYQIIGALKEQGAAILVSTHALQEIDERADRLGVMHGGHLVAFGSLSEIRQQAAPEVFFALTVRPCSTSEILMRLPANVRCVKRDQNTLTLAVTPESKLDVLRQVVTMGDVVYDIRMTEPGLEEIYGRLIAGGAV